MRNFGNLIISLLFQANPMKLVGRIKKVQDELSSLKDQCRQLLIAKQVCSIFNKNCFFKKKSFILQLSAYFRIIDGGFEGFNGVNLNFDCSCCF